MRDSQGQESMQGCSNVIVTVFDSSTRRSIQFEHSSPGLYQMDDTQFVELNRTYEIVVDFLDESENAYCKVRTPIYKGEQQVKYYGDEHKGFIQYTHVDSSPYINYVFGPRKCYIEQSD